MLKKRALLSVTDKTGIVDFAKGLVEKGYEILLTGGTARILRESGIEVITCEDYTGIKQTPLLKTMTDRIYAAIFYPGYDKADVEKRAEIVRDMINLYTQGLDVSPGNIERLVKKLSISPIKLVANNFYNFDETIEDECTLEDAINQIDVGGPTMDRTTLKMALKQKSVAVVVNPKHYGAILEEMGENGELPQDVRNGLAIEAFAKIREYDDSIGNYLDEYAQEHTGWARLPGEEVMGNE